MKDVKPLIEKFSSRYWKAEIQKAEKRAESFCKMAEESIRVFNAQKNIGFLNDTERRLNCWWYCNNTLLPAYYSSTPKAEVNLRKMSGALTEELSAVILERNLQYTLDTEFPFDNIGYTLALHYLITGRAVSWARYEAEIEDEEVEIALIRGEDGSLTDEEGQPFEGDIISEKPGIGNIILVKIKTPKKSEECAKLDVVQYDDYLCSDARTEMEVYWRARRAYLTREEAEKILGTEVADELTYDALFDRDKKDWIKQDDQYEGKAELWEIWCAESEKVYWGHKHSEEFIVYKSEPPIDFEGFFPCTVITQGFDPNSVIPISDYAHVRDQILQIERLNTREAALIQAIRTNFAYDAALGPTLTELFTGDLRGLPVPNWPTHKGNGGLGGSVEYVDITAYTNALQVVQSAKDKALSQLYETLKVSDLLRGTSEQYKSATANRLESQWSSLGLVVRQNMFAKFISDSIDKLGQIIASQYNPEDLFEAADFDNLIAPYIPPAPEPPQPEAPVPGMPPAPVPPPVDPKVWEQQQKELFKQKILSLLRNEDKRCYRIQIASDSMIALDHAQDQQEGTQLMSTAGEFFNQMRALIEQYPPLLPFSIELFKNVVRRFKSGKEVDGLFSKALSQIADVAKAKEEAAKQPPPPDPVMLEMQARMQIAQLESQARIQATQMQMQDAHEKNMLAYQEQQVKLQRHSLESQMLLQKQQFDEYMAQQELAIKQQEVQVKANSVQVDMLKIQAMAEGEQAKHAINQEANRLAGILDVQKLELENMRIRLSESEKLMEERRLASEQQLERVRLQLEQSQNTPKLMGMGMGGLAGSKKSGKIITDENGNPTAIEITTQPEVKIQRITLDAEGNPSGIELG